MPGMGSDKDGTSETGLMPEMTANSTGGILLADQPSYCTSPPIEVVIFGWGVTEDGQLGLDTAEDVPRPSVVESLLGTSFSGFSFNRKPLVAGSRHTLAVTDEGKVLSWGWNDRGTLGLGHRHTTSKPAVIHALEHEHIVQVAAGGWHCLAVAKSGSIYAWGGNEYFQCGVDAGKRDLCIPKPTVPFLRAAMVSCGGMHSVALTDTGEVWQWGEPWGDFSTDVNRSPRKLVASGIVSITSGAFHNLALNSKNRVLAWGTNDFGQLGTGDTTYATEPTLTVGFNDVSVADISAGGWHSLALSSEGNVYTWGRGEYGRLGLNDPKGVSRVRPTLVPGLKDHRVIQALCGGSHTIALTDQGHLFTWGRCTNGRQGFDAQATVELPHPIHMPGGSERWHPICLAAGGRCSMCMVLPRQTVTDHDRRVTAQSSTVSWQSGINVSKPSAPRLIGTQGLKRRASSQALVQNPHLSRSTGALQYPQSLTAAQLVSGQELTFTVPTDRRAFARESTTDFGPSGESSAGSRRVSTLDSAPGDLPSTVSEVDQQQVEGMPASQCDANLWIDAGDSTTFVPRTCLCNMHEITDMLTYVEELRPIAPSDMFFLITRPFTFTVAALTARKDCLIQQLFAHLSTGATTVSATLLRQAESSDEKVDSTVDNLALHFDLSLQSPVAQQPDVAAQEDSTTPRLGDSYLQPTPEEYSYGLDAD